MGFPSLHPLLSDEVLRWLKEAAFENKVLSDIKKEGLRFLDRWHELVPEEQEAVGEVMSAVFRAEDLNEPEENVVETAKQVLNKAPTELDAFAEFAPDLELIDLRLIYILGSFAFSMELLDYESLLVSFLPVPNKASFPINQALAESGLRVLQEIKKGSLDPMQGRQIIALALSCIHPAILRKAVPMLAAA
jgi:hypothetical protein